MLLRGTPGAAVFGTADVTIFIKPYERLSYRTGTDPAADNVLTKYLYHCSEMI